MINNLEVEELQSTNLTDKSHMDQKKKNTGDKFCWRISWRDMKSSTSTN